MISFKTYFENHQGLSKPEQITVTYRTHSGDSDDKVETYSGPNARAQAKEFIDNWVGLNGEIGHNANYIVADDGFGIVAVKGITISELLGREIPKKEPEVGYAKTIGETALKFFSPIIFRGCKQKFGSSGGWTFDWKTNDYSFPVPETEEEMMSVKAERSWKKERGWRFFWSCSFDEYSGDLWASVSIFYEHYRGQNRVFDKSKVFDISNRENDLDIAESILQSIPKDVVKYIENAILENSNKLGG